MLEEPAVFDRENGVNQHFGNFVVMHHLALGALVALEKRRHHLRLKFVGVQLGPRARRDVFDLPLVHTDLGSLGAVIGARPRLNLNVLPDKW